MACRCAEIKKCDHDIRLMEGELAQELRGGQRSGSLEAALAALSRELASTALAENMEQIDKRLAALAKQREKHAAAVQARLSGELTRIRNKRALYENEDRRYHEMLEQRSKR